MCAPAGAAGVRTRGSAQPAAASRLDRSARTRGPAHLHPLHVLQQHLTQLRVGVHEQVVDL